MYLSRYKVHPASTNSAPARMLFGIPGTVNATFAASGSLFISSSFVFVVLIGILDGVSSVLFFCCTFAFLLGVPSMMHVKEAAVSKKQVLLLLFGGGAQARRFSFSGTVVLCASPSLPALFSQLRRSSMALIIASNFLFLFSGFWGQYWGRWYASFLHVLQCCGFSKNHFPFICPLFCFLVVQGIPCVFFAVLISDEFSSSSSCLIAAFLAIYLWAAA